MDMTPQEDLKQWRKALRAELLARRMAIPRKQRQQLNFAVTRNLLEAFPLLRQASIGFYRPMQGEFDPRLALRMLRKQGAVTALAVVAEKNAPLEFREWRPGVRMRRGLFGLPVPEGTRALLPQVLLIPPVGFDAQGYRLGYGGGYFDRTLGGMRAQPLKIGVGFEASRIPTIHPQPHDVPLDFVVTEAGVHFARPASLEPVLESEQAGSWAAHLLCERGLLPGRGQYASPPCYAHEVDPYYWDV